MMFRDVPENVVYQEKFRSQLGKEHYGTLIGIAKAQGFVVTYSAV